MPRADLCGEGVTIRQSSSLGPLLCLYLPAFVPGPLEFATTFGQVSNVYGTTAHHRRTPNGYSGLRPEEWLALSERMRALPSPTALSR